MTELTDISLGDGSHVPGKDEDSQCRNKTNKQNLEGRSCDENVNQGVNTTQWVLSSFFLSAKTQTLHCPWKSMRKSPLPLQKKRQGQQTTATSVFTDLWLNTFESDETILKQEKQLDSKDGFQWVIWLILVVNLTASGIDKDPCCWALL